jgi:hypothetical protein
VELTRRRFFQALAASVVAVGVPLPIGRPARYRVRETDYLTDSDAWFMALARAMQQTKQTVGADVFNGAFNK